MDGSISAESSGVPGEGSAFRLTIQAVAAPDAERTASVAAGRVELDGKRVLVVDDNDTNRRILRAQLDRFGMQTDDTASPLDAYESLRLGASYDLLLLDFHMPGMDDVAGRDAPRRAVTLDMERCIVEHSIDLAGRRARGQRAGGLSIFIGRGSGSPSPRERLSRCSAGATRLPSARSASATLPPGRTGGIAGHAVRERMRAALGEHGGDRFDHARARAEVAVERGRAASAAAAWYVSTSPPRKR